MQVAYHWMHLSVNYFTQKLSIPVGVQSPSRISQKQSEAIGLQLSQTIGQRIMGNMMDNFFVRSFTFKSKTHASNVSVPSSPSKVLCYLILLQLIANCWVSTIHPVLCNCSANSFFHSLHVNLVPLTITANVITSTKFAIFCCLYAVNFWF